MDFLPVDPELTSGKQKQEAEIPLIGDMQLRNDKLDKHLDMQSTIIRTAVEQNDPVQNYLDIKSNPDKESQLQAEVDKKNALDISKVDNWLRQQFATTPEELSDLTNKGKALLNEYKMEHDSPTAKEQAVVDSVTNMEQPFDLRKARQVNAQLTLAVANDVQKIAANQGWLDKAYENFFIYLLPFGTTSFAKDVRDVVGGTIFANGEQLQKFILAFKELPQERQLVVYPKLRDLILRQTDSNQSNAMSLLLSLIEPGEGRELKNRLYSDAFFTALGVTQVASTAKAVAGATKAAAKLTNAAKLAEDVGNTELAGEVAAAAIIDKTGVAAEASKLSPEEAMRAAVPLNLSQGDLGSIPGISPVIQKHVADYIEKLTQVNAGLQDGSLTIREGYVTPKEVTDAAYKEIDNIRNIAKDVYNDTVKVENVNVATADANQATLSFDVLVDGEKKFRLNKTVTATRNDITGTLDLNEVPTNRVANYIFSPSFRYVIGKLKDLAQTAARNLLSSNVNQNALRSLWREANKGLSTKEMSKLDQVMMAGDLYEDEAGNIGKNFSVLELRAGIDTPKGVIKLDTDKQIAAYYKNRAFMDMVGNLESVELRTKLQSQGWKSTYLDSTMVMIKPYEAETAQAEITKGSVKRILDLDENKMISIGSDNAELVEKLKSKTLVRLHEDLPIDPLKVDDLQEGEHVRYVLINKNAVRALPQDVLTMKKGYVPALYKNEEFFVKQKMYHVSNDEQVFQDITLSRFASKKQAQLSADALNAKALLEGKWDGKPTTAPFRMLGNHELTVEQLLGDSSVSGRSFVFGKRSTRSIPFGQMKTTPERISVLEAFDRNIRQLSKLMAYNSYRIRSEQLWLNTAKEWGFDLRSFNEDVPRGTKITDQLMNLKDQIRTWNQIPTKEERLWSQIWQSVHDWMVDGSHSVGVPKDSFSSILWLKHADPIRSARAAAFHPLLGMLNISQLLVQSSQAAISASLRPLNSVRAFKYAMSLRYVDLMQDEKALVTNLDKLRAHPEFKEIAEDVHELAQLWQRSGFGLASKFNSNYEMASDVAGFSKGIFRTLLEKGEYFYQAGVNFANRFAFSNAYMEFKKLNFGKVSDEGLKQIIAQTDRDTFHMLSSDKAAIYKSGFSIPLQFSQIIMKSVEAILGKEFTFGQKARILTGQLALYGLAGYNLSKVFDMSMRGFGVDPTQLKGSAKGVYTALSGGMLQATPLLLLGADLDLSNRTAIFNGVGQWGIDMVLDDRPLWQKALGAFGTVAGKVQRTVDRLSTIALGALGDEPMTKGDIILGLQEILKIPSSTNNLITAIYMSRFGKILDKNGIPIIDKDFPTAEIIAQAVGFKPSIVSQTYELARYNVLREKDIDDLAKKGIYLLNNYRELFYNPDAKEQSINTRKAFQAILMPLNEMERAAVLKKMKSMIEHPKNKYDQALNDFFKNALPNDFMGALMQDKQDAANNGIVTEEVK